MLGKFRTGLITSSEGSENVPRSDKQGALVITQSGGLYKEPSRNGTMAFSYCASRATTEPATAMVGNIVWNPPGSGRVLSLAQWQILIHVTSAACIGVTLGYSSQGLTPTSTTVADAYGDCYLNSGSPAHCVVKAYAIATLLAAPVPVMPLFHNTAAIATTGTEQIAGDFGGIWTVPPGYAICLCALGDAVAASGMTSTITWEEIPE